MTHRNVQEWYPHVVSSSITFDGDFDRNSVSFLVRIYPLRISRQGPDIILNEEESRNCVVLNMIRSSLL